MCRAAASGDPRSLIRIIRGELIRVVNTYYTARSRAVFAKSQPGKIATARMDTMLVCTGVCIHGVTTHHYLNVYKDISYEESRFRPSPMSVHEPEHSRGCYTT